jgi:hypothetical protein
MTSHDITNPIKPGNNEDFKKFLDEGAKKSAHAYSDEGIVSSLSSAPKRIAKVKFLAKLLGVGAEAEALSKSTEEAGKIGSAILDIERDIGIPTDISKDMNKTHETTHQHGGHFIVPEQHALDHPIPHTGNYYTYVPNSPRDNKTNIMSVS